jgi:hypothetical protein
VITYREEPVARSICSSSGDVEENQPAMIESCEQHAKNARNLEDYRYEYQQRSRA